VRAAAVASLILLTTSRAAAADFDELLRRAAEARRAGNSEETLEFLQQAYAQRALPEILNNIGRTLEELGRYGEAADAYHRVLDDPNAKAALLDLDRQRLAALEPKLGRAWLLVSSADARAFLDGDPIQTGAEIEIPPGPHLLELSAEEHALLVFFSGLPSRRAEIARNPREKLETESILDVEGAPITKLFVNDRPIASPLPRLRIALPPGSYRIRAETAKGVLSKPIRVHEGRTLSLVAEIAEPRGEPPPPAIAVAETPHVTPVGPIVLGALGIASVVVGTALAVVAEKDRDRVREAQTEGDTVIGLYMIEADALEARANDRGTASIVAFCAAGALGIGAALWWIFGTDMSF
jgi:hypothetical protein